MGASVSETMWHYADGAATTGPVAHADLCALFAGGRLPLDTPVWNEAMEDWAPAATVGDFRDIWGKAFAGAGSARPPPAPPLPGVARPGMAGEIDSHVRQPDKRWQAAPQVRPWVRSFARGVDNTILGFAGVALLVATRLVTPATGPWEMLGYNYLILLVGSLVFFPLQLALFGRTLGKAYFGISVVNEHGRWPTPWQAFVREWRVLLNGMGLGVLIIPLFTMFTAYRRLKTDGITSWDCEGGLTVRHRPATVRIGIYLAVNLIAVAAVVFSFARQHMAYPARADRRAAPWVAPVVITPTPPRPADRSGAAPSAKKPRPKPKLLTLPSQSGAAGAAVKPSSPATRPTGWEGRPPPGVTFKPDPQDREAPRWVVRPKRRWGRR